MKRKTWTVRATLVILFAISIMGAMSSVTAQPNPAMVVNFGRDGRVCVLEHDDFEIGEGHATVVVTHSNRVTFSCAGELEEGEESPSSAQISEVECILEKMVILGRIVFTPSGHFSGSCTGRINP